MCVKPRRHLQYLLELSNSVETANFEAVTGYGVLLLEPWVLVAAGDVSRGASSFILGSQYSYTSSPNIVVLN